METRDVFVTVLALLIYLGPLVPLAATLLFWRASRERLRRNLLLLFIAISLQAVSLLPFVFAELAHKAESEDLLSLPALTGLVMFVAFSIYAVCECVRLRALIKSHHDA